MSDLSPALRAPLLALGFAGLVTGILAGLGRLAWPVPEFATGAPHGPLMLCAFFCTLISLERAVAIGRLWAYGAPLAGGIGSLILVTGSGESTATWFFLFAGIILVSASIYAQRLQNVLHSKIISLGAAAWLAGVSIWLVTGNIYQAQWWWLAFLVITIAGERLELSRLVRVSPRMTRTFIVLMALLVTGSALASFRAELRLLGVALFGLALWLWHQDIARKTVKGRGLTRYIAICLLGGYIWLGVSGLCLALLAPTPGTTGWDTAIHALTLGFVFAMVFGHAPIILPAVLRLKLPYHWIFYLPLGLLHLGVALRTMGDLGGLHALQSHAGLCNAIAIGLFLLMQLASIAGGNRRPLL